MSEPTRDDHCAYCGPMASERIPDFQIATLAATASVLMEAFDCDETTAIAIARLGSMGGTSATTRTPPSTRKRHMSTETTWDDITLIAESVGVDPKDLALGMITDLERTAEERRDWIESQGGLLAALDFAADPTDAYLRRMALMHPDWRPLDVLRAVLDALLAQAAALDQVETP